jgi:hypothetical protein
MIAPATRRGVTSDRRFCDGPLNLGVGGGWIVLVWVEFVTVGSAGSPGSLAILHVLCSAELSPSLPLQTLIQQLLHDRACVVCSCIDIPHEQADEDDVDEDQCKELRR